jgi:Ser/Thr protein kinase RdoA (MazF antagonist)
VVDNLSGDLAWAEQQLRNYFGCTVHVGQAVRMPARTGRLNRIEVSAEGRTTNYFLKHYTPHGVSDWAVHADHLRLVVNAFDDVTDVLRYQIVAVDAGRGLLLAAEMSGRTISRREDLAVVWRGVGRWLAALHRAHVSTSAERPSILLASMEPRFRHWMDHDPKYQTLALRGIDAATSLVAQLGANVPIALCHCDVTSANIRLQGQRVGLIDFDDLRFDMPGVDLSQAHLEIAALSLQVLRPGLITRRARAALREGYGAGFPEGPQFWLPHLRNLAMHLATLVTRRDESWRARLAYRRRYRSTVAELERTLVAIRG